MTLDIDGATVVAPSSTGQLPVRVDGPEPGHLLPDLPRQRPQPEELRRRDRGAHASQALALPGTASNPTPRG